MTTEVVMKRYLFDNEISQKSKSEFFSATDLVRAGNIWRVSNKLPFFDMSAWFNSASTKEFIESLSEKYGEVKISARGRGGHTWVHPLLFIDMALAISPKLKIEVYEWMFDHLLKYRNESGDSYKKMCGALFEAFPNKRDFPGFISNVADKIKASCNVTDWQRADELSLSKRDKIHEAIALLSDILPVDEAVRIGIHKATKQ